MGYIRIYSYFKNSSSGGNTYSIPYTYHEKILRLQISNICAWARVTIVVCKQNIIVWMLLSINLLVWCGSYSQWVCMVWLLLSMNLYGVDVAHNEFEWRGWMLLSMNLHGADVALNEYAWCGCCSQWICMVLCIFLSMNLNDMDVVLNEFAWCGCCSRWICMVWMLLSMNF